jgi:hypothetical protein
MRTHALIQLALIAALAAVANVPGSAAADEGFSIVINGRTGTALLRNDGPTAVNLDGYLLRSPNADVLDPLLWDSLESNPGTPGWLESHSAADRLGEANLFSSTSVPAGGSIPIGSPYIPFAPEAFGDAEPGLDSFNFTYSLHEGDGSLVGDVEFIDRNTVVLVVDPETGAASLKNQSQFNINLESYLIRSVPSVLDVEGWTPLEESLGVPGGWTASSGEANRIAEGNLFSSTFLAANGGSLPLGSPIDANLLTDETDLILEFTVTGMDALDGGVLFAAAPSDLPGDYNGDGRVDAGDYVRWRNNLGDPTEADINDNGDGGGVTISDYGWWTQNYGTPGAGGGGLTATASAPAVPEPAAWLLAAVAVCGCGIARRRTIG